MVGNDAAQISASEDDMTTSPACDSKSQPLQRAYRFCAGYNGKARHARLCGKS